MPTYTVKTSEWHLSPSICRRTPHKSMYFPTVWYWEWRIEKKIQVLLNYLLGPYVGKPNNCNPHFILWRYVGIEKRKEEKEIMAKWVWAVAHYLEVSQNLATMHSCYISFPFTIDRSLSHSPGQHCPRCCLNTEQKDSHCHSLQSQHKNNKSKQEAIC